MAGRLSLQGRGADPKISVLLRGPLTPGRRHFQESLLFVLGLGFPGQTNEFLGDAAVFFCCAHDMPTTQLMRTGRHLIPNAQA